ncbi:hypothetical protein DXZ20_06460 [Leptolyngbyaceae cyanobacterium CCMR0081]|uniref:Uncharacterized protein n=1 Tax=Adonisia turfae CCMR0081 TaxID=2292702 RepID=A0A6M0RGF9_9CYAN|nr:hypothetical protein [Adonisia turfae CCMR0081]
MDSVGKSLPKDKNQFLCKKVAIATENSYQKAHNIYAQSLKKFICIPFAAYLNVLKCFAL